MKRKWVSITHVEPTAVWTRRSPTTMKHEWVSTDRTRLRIWPFLILVMTGLSVLLLRLGQLTLVEGAYFRGRADRNRSVVIRETAPRGVMFDRNGTPLVRNVPFYKRQVPGTTIHEAKFESLTKEEALKLAYTEQGERIFYDMKRDYPCGRACSILLGFTGEVSETDLRDLIGDYVVGDSLGKSGLEKWYEKDLRGFPGEEMVEVGADGYEVRTIGEAAAKKGMDIHLTIDQTLQLLMYEAMGTHKGAVIAQVPQTGEVVALVSSPAFDPASMGASLTEADEPFFNRALSGVYPPGSVFKIVTSCRSGSQLR